MSHNNQACALESKSYNYWARVPRAHALQQEKPPQWEAWAPQARVAHAKQWGPSTVKPSAAKKLTTILKFLKTYYYQLWMSPHQPFFKRIIV